MKRIVIVVFLCLSNILFAQRGRSIKIGKTTLQELQMMSYEKDTTANALVLEEYGYMFPDQQYNFSPTTERYSRIKLFNKEGFDQANIQINLYKKEVLKSLEAITYNLVDGQIQKNVLSKSDIYTQKITDNYQSISFTFPNVKEGSVIEYKYSVMSPYTSIDDWYFQSDIPKLKSKLTTYILENYKYRKRLSGFLSVKKEEDRLDDACASNSRGFSRGCYVLTLSMDSVPAFKEEDYLTSKENYISKLSFDLESILTSDGLNKFTTDWKRAERNLKVNFLNKQGTKKSYFRKNIPSAILAETSELEKAKKVYGFIKDYYNWNGNYWISSKIDIKESFKEKTGSVDAINLSLFNSLQAADIESYIVLLSTRRNGIPTKLYPIVTQFNYIIVKAIIDGKEYFLDASDKFLSFGDVPFQCLNGEVRVLDFKKGGYWQDITKRRRAERKVTYDVNFNEDQNIEANVKITSSRYFAHRIRSQYEELGEDEYITRKESSGQDFEIDDYQIANLKEYEKPIDETFTLVSDDSFEGVERINLSPIIYRTTPSNPFKLEERLYPVDFGYQRFVTQRININIPEGYEVVGIPKDVGVKLPNKGGSYLFKVQKTENQVKIYIRYQIARKVFDSDEYYYLKEFFNKIIEAEKESIVLQKK